MEAEGDNTVKVDGHDDSVATVTCPKCGLKVALGTKFCPNDATPIVAVDSSLAVPGYKFVKLIGSGGMGDVYEAEHVVLRKSVAIKTLKSHLLETTAFRRFQTEAQAASKLSHPNIVSVYDCGVSNSGDPYMIMDLVKGETLAQYLKRKGALSIEESMQIISDVCAGVICAHDKNILHRDLKPSNVILDETDKKRIARILDFGIAKMLENDDMVARMTRTGEVMGTPSYMSPEQVNGDKLDQRSDIYSIGCIFYEMLTGSPPILGKTVMETMVRQLNEIPLSLSQAALKKFPEELEQIVARALAKDPADRFQTVKQMLFVLESYRIGAEKQVVERVSVKNGSGHVFILPAIAAAIFVLMVSLYLATFRKFNDTDATTEANKMAAASSTSLSASPALATTTTKENRIGKLLDGSVPDDLFKSYLLNNARSPNISVGKLGDITDYTDISDEALAPLKNFYQLRDLNLGDCEKITVKGLENLVALPKLRKLQLADTNIGDEVFPLLEKMKLDFVNLGRTKVTDKGLLSLNPNVSLKEISLKGTHITDEGLRGLVRLKHLKSLNLDSCPPISDKGVASLSKMDLVSLSLQGTSITSGCVKSILKMQNMARVGCTGTELDDNALEQLGHLKKLVVLNVTQCPRISPEAIEKFRKSHPNCNLITER